MPRTTAESKQSFKRHVSQGFFHLVFIKHPTPWRKPVSILSLVKLAAKLVVGLRHLVQLLPLLGDSPPDMLHSRAQRVRCVLTRPAIADLWHLIEPCINLRRFMVLTNVDLERLQGRLQLVVLQANPAQLRSERQTFLTHEQATVTQPALEIH